MPEGKASGRRGLPAAALPRGSRPRSVSGLRGLLPEEPVTSTLSTASSLWDGTVGSRALGSPWPPGRWLKRPAFGGESMPRSALELFNSHICFPENVLPFPEVLWLGPLYVRVLVDWTVRP